MYKATSLKLLCAVTGLIVAIGPDISWADGPFGISMGQDPSKVLSCVSTSTVGVYRCKTLPKPHAEFDAYDLLSSKDTGVCEIHAVGRDVPDSGSGYNTRSKTDDVAAQIAMSYGTSTTTFDFLHAEALWKDDGEWLMAIAKDERTYAWVWEKNKFASKNNVSDIAVVAHATGRDVGWVGVSIAFSNAERCKESRTKEAAAVF